MKTSYHPSVLIAFYLHCLPEDMLQTIPCSTKYDWRHKDISTCFGYDWYCHNQHLFYTLQKVAGSKRLLKANRALLRIIAVQHFLKKYATQIQKKIFNAANITVNNIRKHRKYWDWLLL